MNFSKGGPRVLKTCLVLIWILVSGLTLLVFFGTSPENIRYDASTFGGVVIGVGAASILAGHFFLLMMTAPNKDQTSPPGGVEFTLSLWGMASAFIGWYVGHLLVHGLFGVIPAAGDWLPPIAIFPAALLSSGITTLVVIGVIWGVPLAVFGFFGWIYEGFSTKE